jgi:hypothetical protein
LAKLGNPSKAQTRLFWALEDYRIALFVQEYGSPRKVSKRILEDLWAELEAPRAQVRKPAIKTSAKQAPERSQPKKPASPAASRPPAQSDLDALKRLFES